MFDRTSVICTALLLGLAAFVWTDVSINFLYVRERFNWSLEKYTLFSSIEMCIYICGTLLTVYVLHKIVHIPETVLMLIACISLLNGSLMFALAKHDSVIYLGMCSFYNVILLLVSFFILLTQIIVRTFLFYMRRSLAIYTIFQAKI